MKYYLCTITEMYDGREFDYSQYIVQTDQRIFDILEKHVENITDEDGEDWTWEGKWWSNCSESAYTVGAVTEIPHADISVLIKHFNLVKT